MTYRILLGATAVALALCIAASPRKEFNAAYRAYGDAVAESRFGDAATHAGEALQLGRDVLAPDSPEIALLAFNHGFALAKAGRASEAYRALLEARGLVEKALGGDAVEIVQVEVELAHTGSPEQARQHFDNALALASRRHGEDSEFVADLKVEGATQILTQGTTELLAGAAGTYERLARTDKLALARYWLGHGHLDEDRYRDAIEPMSAVVAANPSDRELVLMARAKLVEAFERLGERDRATEHCLAIGSARGFTRPERYKPLFVPDPVYPEELGPDAGIGSVTMEFTVDAEGYVRHPLVVESRGGGAFASAALALAERIRYAPQFVDDQPLAVPGVRHTVVFSPP